MAVTADFRDIKVKGLPKADFPATVFEEYRVHMKREAFERMTAHARTTSEVELCGVLIGQVAKDERGPFLKVTAIIEGENANNYGAQVTFTQQTWNHINEVKDREHPDDRIVGWYHTHPGFGIFLSGMDAFIQENFFNMPYQAAIVIETKQDKIGCFIWKDGKSTPLARMWVGDDEMPLAGGSSESFDAEKIGTDDAPDGKPRVSVAAGPHHEDPSPYRWTFALVIGMLMLLLGLQWGRSSTYHDLRQYGLDMLESEIYDVLEFAAVTQVAAEDMAKAREKVTAARKQMEDGNVDAAKAGLDLLKSDLEKLEKAYHRPRSEYREQLMKTTGRKKLLAERIDSLEQLQKEQSMCVANIYMLHLATMIQLMGINPEDVVRLPEREREALRSLVDTILRLAPEAKRALEARHPGLLKALYPSSRTPQPKDGTKPEKKEART